MLSDIISIVLFFLGLVRPILYPTVMQIKYKKKILEEGIDYVMLGKAFHKSSKLRLEF